MTKAEKFVRYIFALCFLAVLLGVGCLFGIFLGTGLNKSDPNADLGVEKVQQEENVATAQATANGGNYILANGLNSYNIYAKCAVAYNTKNVNSVTIQNFTAGWQGGIPVVKWSPMQFTVDPKSSYSSLTSITLTVRKSTYDDDYDFFCDEFYDLDLGLFDAGTSYTFTRSGNVFSCSSTFGKSYEMQPSSTTYITFGVDISNAGIFQVTQTLTPVAKPVPKGGTSYAYTGSSITHQVNNYNTNYMTRSGTASAINAGNYTVTYTLKSGYCWSDNTTSVVSLSWKITQATNSWTSQPSIPNWTLGSAPSTINVGTPKFGSSSLNWVIFNADIFETMWLVDKKTMTYFDFSLEACRNMFVAYATNDIWTNGFVQQDCVYDNSYGNITGGNNGEEDVVSFSYLKSGRYYFYVNVQSTSSYTYLEQFQEFYVYAPAPTVTVGTYTYNGNDQGPTITGNTAYYTTVGTTTAKNAGGYSFYINANYGTDSYSGYNYPYYFNGRGDMSDLLDDLGYDSLAECYNSEGWSRNTYAYMILDHLGSNYFQVSYTINKASVTKPTLTTTHVTYNRAAQGPGNVTAAQTNITKRTGTTSATNAGTYYIYYELLDTTNYQWAGGGNGKLTRTWYIDKANISGATVTIPQTDYTYDGSAKKPDPTVTV